MFLIETCICMKTDISKVMYHALKEVHQSLFLKIPFVSQLRNILQLIIQAHDFVTCSYFKISKIILLKKCGTHKLKKLGPVQWSCQHELFVIENVFVRPNCTNLNLISGNDKYVWIHSFKLII